jgi:hypothetical protein
MNQSLSLLTTTGFRPLTIAPSASPTRPVQNVYGPAGAFRRPWMPDFTSEDDIGTFEGWLKYQVGDAILAPDQLEMWRSVYEDCRPSGSFGLTIATCFRCRTMVPWFGFIYDF